ncbi:hypothetical protein BOO71_0008227 [Deinococcus marmoris]|uniref:Uncharacterized protein n=1 Tax=Deinococcus marmoris TaxID=249408 RepID=A0A1U7NXC5_9DEIO|nr:hypothetical protein BOO71_0008227 [Deinococcus marmoris]
MTPPHHLNQLLAAAFSCPNPCRASALSVGKVGGMPTVQASHLPQSAWSFQRPLHREEEPGLG